MKAAAKSETIRISGRAYALLKRSALAHGRSLLVELDWLLGLAGPKAKHG